MPSINGMVDAAKGLLQSKTLVGGVTRESAEKGIQKVAEDVYAQMQTHLSETVAPLKEEIGVLKNELSISGDVFNKFAQEAKEAAVSLKTENSSLVEQLKVLQEKLAKAVSKKIYEKPLANGGKEVTEINRKGAKAVKTYNAEGQLTKKESATLHGIRRNVTYNTVTGKPAKTFTNVGGDKLFMHGDDGKVSKITELKVTKVKPEPPASLGKRVTEKSGNGMTTVENFADGSKIERKYFNGVLHQETKRGSNDWIASSKYTSDDGVVNLVKRKNFSLSSEKLEKRYPSGHISKMRNVTDSKTLIESRVESTRFPQSSEFKEYVFKSPLNSKNAGEAELTAKNGDIYKLTDFRKEPANSTLTPYNGLEIAVPQKVTKIAANGTTTEMAQNEIRPWLESFHPEYNFSLRYK